MFSTVYLFVSFSFPFQFSYVKILPPKKHENGEVEVKYLSSDEDDNAHHLPSRITVRSERDEQ